MSKQLKQETVDPILENIETTAEEITTSQAEPVEEKPVRYSIPIFKSVQKVGALEIESSTTSDKGTVLTFVNKPGLNINVDNEFTEKYDTSPGNIFLILDDNTNAAISKEVFEANYKTLEETKLKQEKSMLEDIDTVTMKDIVEAKAQVDTITKQLMGDSDFRRRLLYQQLNTAIAALTLLEIRYNLL